MRARRADRGEGRSWAAIVSDPEKARVTRQRCGPPVGWWAAAPSRAELSGESVGEVRRRVDLQQPVVLRDALPAGRRSRLELAATGADGQVGDEAVVGLTGPVRHHLCVPGFPAEVHRLEGLADGPDLVQLDQCGVADLAPDGLGDDRRVGDEDVVADDLGDTTQIVGDDIFVTNPAIITEAIGRKVGNSALIKLNQIGSVSETLEAMHLCRKAGYTQMVSHRSGETDDSFIADLTVGTGCGQLKSGAPALGERVAKYNRLLEIDATTDLAYGLT